MSLTGLYGASEEVMNMPIIPCVERQGIILSFICSCNDKETNSG